RAVDGTLPPCGVDGVPVCLLGVSGRTVAPVMPAVQEARAVSARERGELRRQWANIVRASLASRERDPGAHTRGAAPRACAGIRAGVSCAAQRLRALVICGPGWRLP